MNIPRAFEFPGGFHITVRHVTYEKLQDLNGDTDEVDSLWHWDEDNGGTIYLVKGRGKFQRVKDFIHETRHAHCEWQTWFERKAGGIG